MFDNNKRFNYLNPFVFNCNGEKLKNKTMSGEKWRHEYKYFSPGVLLDELEKRCSVILKKDKNTGEKGFYHIRSIYFDDMYNTCYFENEDGTDPREKFRIRIYNNSDKKVSLELKQRRMGKCHKLSSPLSIERLEKLIEGSFHSKILIPDADDSCIYKRFYSEILFRNLHPVTIVSYDRVPFVCNTGNVRVTFDRNIRSSDSFKDFFSEGLFSRPILPAGTNLLEVKFDELLPDYIYDCLSTEKLKQTSFSKYYLCRKYNMKGTL